VIVFDKFHVIMHATIAVDETRRVECRLTNKPDRDLLKEYRWVLLKNPANQTDKQALKYTGLLKPNLSSVKAHQMRLVLQEIYTLPTAALARRKLRAWCRWVRWVAGKQLMPRFSSFVKTAAKNERHLPGILAHWTHRTTHAFMEGLNSVFSGVKRKARGFRSVDNLIAMLYFTAGHLNLPATH
jgi:transposase